MPGADSTTLAQTIKAVYDANLLARAVPNLIHAVGAQRRDIVPGDTGDKVRFTRYGALALNTTPLTEGTPPAGKNLSTTQLDIAPQQYGDFVPGTDRVSLVSYTDVLGETSNVLGEQAGQTLDAVIREGLVVGSNVKYAGGASSRATVAAANTLTLADVRKARFWLEGQNAPKFGDGSYLGKVHPNALGDLMTDPLWLDVSKYSAAQQLFQGEIGQIYGVRFIASTQSKVFTGAGASAADVYASLFHGANAFGVSSLRPQDLEFIFKPLGSAGVADPLNQKWTAGWKASMAAAILNQAFLLRYEHGATAYNV